MPYKIPLFDCFHSRRCRFQSPLLGLPIENMKPILKVEPILKLETYVGSRIHLTRFRHLNEFSSPDFEFCTDSYVLIPYVCEIYVRLISSTYVLYDNKYLRTYFMTILPCRICTSSYESDKIVRFSALVGVLQIYKKRISRSKITFRQTLKV